MEIESEDCLRFKMLYRGENLYATVSPTKIHLSIINRDRFRTLAGMALIERLLNELLDRGVSLEELAGIAFECSYQTTDLPGLLSKVLEAVRS